MPSKIQRANTEFPDETNTNTPTQPTTLDADSPVVTSDRNALRDAAFSGVLRSRKVEYRGQEFEVKQCTMKQRLHLSKIATDSSGEINQMLYLAHLILNKTFVPSTGERVFTSQDLEAILATPDDGLIRVLGDACIELLTPPGEEEGKGSSEEAAIFS